MPKLVKTLSIMAICFAAAAFAATKPDFSGTYAAQQKRGNKTNAPSLMLRVFQSDGAIEVTRVYGDTTVTNRFPLDGSGGDYTTETGVRGNCKAHLKKETLVLETFVVSRPIANGPSIRIHTTEQWRLSDDRNTLTIKTEIDFPDMPRDVVAASFPNNPSTEKYQRSDRL